jgi:hypothetical protein
MLVGNLGRLENGEKGNQQTLASTEKPAPNGILKAWKYERFTWVFF